MTDNTRDLAHVSTDLVRNDNSGALLTGLELPISGDELARIKAEAQATEVVEQDDVFGGYGQGFTTACILAAIGHAPDNCECSESYRQRGEHTPGCPADTGERV